MTTTPVLTARSLLDTNILLHWVRRDTLYHWIMATYELSNALNAPLISFV